MICRLCKQDRTLLKKSHIIPDFMYQNLYDKNHRFHQLIPKKYIEDELKSIPKFSGEYDQNILCQKCDNELIGNLESYTAKTMYGGELKPQETPETKVLNNPHGLPFYHISNIDYSKYKLFLLSILWRSAISNRPFFSSVTLGPHEEQIRLMLLNNDPGNVEDYPIFFMTFLNDSNFPKDIITDPRTTRFKEGGHRAIVFIITGVVYVFFTGSKDHKLPDHIKYDTINPNNYFNIYHIPKGSGMRLILSYYGIH